MTEKQKQTAYVHLRPGDVVTVPDGEPSRFGLRYGVVNDSAFHEAMITWMWETFEDIGNPTVSRSWDLARWGRWGDGWYAGPGIELEAVQFSGTTINVAHFAGLEPPPLTSTMQNVLFAVERAAHEFELAMISAIDRATGEPVALLTLNRLVGGTFYTVPLAVVYDYDLLVRFAVPDY